MKLTYDEMVIASIALRDRSDSLGGVEEMLKLADKLDKARGATVSFAKLYSRCTQRNIGMKSNRCALPKNHGGACRAPRTGDRIRWKKLGIYEKEWPS